MSNTIPPRKRGRPTNAERAARSREAASNGQAVGQVIEKHLSDAELLSDIQYRFELVSDMTKAVIAGDIRSFIVSGAAGMSKTFTIEGVLESAAENDGIKVEIAKGKLTPINFYMMLYRNREKNNIVVLDDVDFFKDEISLSLAKAAFDTSVTRRITWGSEASVLKEEDIPKSFAYQGGAIFITNTDMQGISDAGTSKLAPHMKALISRSAYLDLNLHETRPKMVWIRHITDTYKMLTSEFGITQDESDMILTFMQDNVERLRDVSLRAAKQLAQYYKLNPLNWKRTAEMMMMR